jgi:hypothetical protein
MRAKERIASPTRPDGAEEDLSGNESLNIQRDTQHTLHRQSVCQYDNTIPQHPSFQDQFLAKSD